MYASSASYATDIDWVTEHSRKPACPFLYGVANLGCLAERAQQREEGLLIKTALSRVLHVQDQHYPITDGTVVPHGPALVLPR